jgi:hypothetical protein
MKKYQQFLESKQFEQINESIVYLSPKLREEIKKIKHPIAKELTEFEGQEDKERDITFLDIDSREGYINFKTMKSMMKQIEDSGDDFNPNYKDPVLSIDKKSDKFWSDYIYNENPEIWKRSRNPIKLGALINNFFPGKYDANRDIEPFVRKFKALQRGESLAEVEIVEGKDIAFWYDSNNYLQQSGTLGTSCMRNKSDSIFQIYVDNPDICKMACIFEDDDEGNKKLVARALLWKPDFKKPDKFEWFMDRQYAINENYITDLRNWAKSKRYAYKTLNNHHSLGKVSFGDDDFDCTMEIELPKYVYEEFPFMDTFRRLDPDEYILHNDHDKIEGHYLLNSTSGDFEEVSSGVWSEWIDDMIPEEDAVYSQHVDSYLRETDAVYVMRGSRNYHGWWPSEHDSIVRDPDGRPMHVDDACWSDYYAEYILADDSVSVVEWVDKWGDCNQDDCWLKAGDSDYVNFYQIESIGGPLKLNDMFWYEHCSEQFSNWENHQGILRSLLRKDWQNNWILKDFSIILYKCKEGSEFEWLDQAAATVLNIETLEEDRVSCIMEYFKVLSETLDKEYGDLEEMLDLAMQKVDSETDKSVKFLIDKIKVMK